jgi:seryl-tRNA synthetase
MLNIDLIRRDPDQVRDALNLRGELISLDKVLGLDTERRGMVSEGDKLRAQRNQVSQEISKSKDRPPEIIEQMRNLGNQIKKLEDEVREIDEQLRHELLALPNIPLPGVPEGAGESDNVVVRSWGDPIKLGFTPKAHWELGESLDVIDMPRGAKISGSRFSVLKGLGARLSRALISWMLDLHTQEHGYVEIAPPYLVKRETLIGSGQLPKFADSQYWDTEDDLWLIPTAEVPLTGLHGDEILEPGLLPLNYVAYTACFRRERAAAGRETRGIKRVNQFDKVELYKLVDPANSASELDRLVADVEEIAQRLGLAYRVVELCTGDLGFVSAKTYDIEVWACGSGEWLEVSSCSACTDFQARRSNIRYRSELRGRPQYVHTLNGSGLAIPRVLIAILENYQQPDGSVLVPDVLRSYVGVDVIRP